MDGSIVLSMFHSVPESVENNGNRVPAEYPDVMNHRSSKSTESGENGLLLLPDDECCGSRSPQQSSNVDSFKVRSPGGSVHSRRKGFGLKKWRRIKRDSYVKDEGDPVDDGSKLLKRGLTGSVNPPCKHVDLSSIEARQCNEGSVGSLNMLPHHHPGVANRFSPDLGLRFTVGQAFEKSKEHSSNSTGAKNVGGKTVSGSQGKIWSHSIKKASEERAKADKEKPCSSLDSDLRSSSLVFPRLMNHTKGFDKEGQVREEVEADNTSGEKDEDGDESKKSNHYWADKDQIADSIRNLAALQEALWKEVQSFQELGKEPIQLHLNIDDLSSSDQPKNENCREENSTSSGSQALILKRKVKHLEHKLEEARTILEGKEARIQELVNSKIESELEGIFQRKIESEIEHLMLTRSLNSSIPLLQKPKKLHSLSEHEEPNRGNIIGKTCTFSFYILSQMILLVFILHLLILQFSPASRLVLPT